MRYNMQKSNKSTEKRFYKTLKTTATAVRGPDEILTGTTKAGDGAMMVCPMCPVFAGSNAGTVAQEHIMSTAKLWYKCDDARCH